jgi:hypothetical protein
MSCNDTTTKPQGKKCKQNSGITTPTAVNSRQNEDLRTSIAEGHPIPQGNYTVDEMPLQSSEATGSVSEPEQHTAREHCMGEHDEAVPSNQTRGNGSPSTTWEATPEQRGAMQEACRTYIGDDSRSGQQMGEQLTSPFRSQGVTNAYPEGLVPHTEEGDGNVIACDVSSKGGLFTYANDVEGLIGDVDLERIFGF